MTEQQLNFWDYYNQEGAFTGVSVSTYIPRTPLEMVRDFQGSMGQEMDREWKGNARGKDTLDEFRFRLLNEEFREVQDSGTAEELLKELADLLYVTYGYAATFGWDLDEAFKRVHESNMSKLGEDGKPIRREDGKVLKGPNYKPPYLGDLV